MKISREQVDHVALLARIELSEQERETFTEQLSAILEYIEQLNELDTASVEPMAHAATPGNVLRPDEPRPSLSTDEMLANAPDRTESSYKVPRVID